MTAKQFLSRGRWIEREIQSLMKTRDETKDRLTSITQNYDSDGAQSSKDPHKFDALVELEDRIGRKIDELYCIKNEILDTIFRLDDPRERMVLKGRYVDMQTWEQIAVEMSYSYMQVTRIHGYALNSIKDVIECYTDSVV